MKRGEAKAWAKNKSAVLVFSSSYGNACLTRDGVQTLCRRTVTKKALADDLPFVGKCGGCNGAP